MDEEIFEEELKDEGMFDKDEEKPKCRLNLDDKNSLNLIRVVANTLQSAGFGERASGFAERASRCVNSDEVFSIAKEYVKIA